MARPYVLTDSVTLSANSTGQLELPVGANEDFEGYEIFFTSTSTFNITAITNTSGVPFTNADTTNVIPNTLFTSALDQRTNVGVLQIPINISGNDKLVIDLTDTSGSSNTVRVFIRGVMYAAGEQRTR
jgi:hypothetical protein